LIESLDVEEKAQAKDTTEKGEGHATATLCRKVNPQARSKRSSGPLSTNL
jgi:hypothetical protein